MASFEIQWRSSTKKDLRNLPRHDIVRIIAAVEQLTEDSFPHGSQKLAGSERTYRVRVGDYRIIYEVLVEEKVVQIQRVRHRKDVYR